MLKRLMPFVIVVLLAVPALAQGPAKTTIQDTIYAPNGQLANGSVIVRAADSFTSADGYTISQYTQVSANITNGVLSIALVPNAGSTPTSYYYATYYLTAQTGNAGTFVEYWDVPSSATPVNLAAVRVASPPSLGPVVSFTQLNPPPGCLSTQGPVWLNPGWGCGSTSGLVNPMTTLGDTLYQGALNAPVRLGGNTTTTPEVLCSTGTGTAATAPLWSSSCGSASMVYPGVGATWVSGTSTWGTPYNTTCATALTFTAGTGFGCNSAVGGLFSSFQAGTNTAITTTENYFHIALGSGMSSTYTGSGTSGSPYVWTLSATGSGLPSCTTDQLLYYASSGTTGTCLAIGTNLSISSGTLNASGGSSIPSASANLKEAAPIQIPGSAVVFSPDPTVCSSTPSTATPSLTQCAPERPLIVGHFYLGYFDPEETTTGPTCTISDSLGNTITTANPSGSLTWPVVFYMKVTVGGADTFTPSAGCGLSSGSGEMQQMTFVDIPNGESVGPIISGLDSCGNSTLTNKCSTTVTTDQPGAAIFSFADNTFYSTTPVQITTSPAAVTFANNNGQGSYQFTAQAAPVSGSYTTYASDPTTAIRFVSVVVYPTTTTIVGTAVATVASSGSVTSISYAQSISVGNTLAITLRAVSFTSPTACTATDSAGNTFSTGFGNLTGGGTLISHITVAAATDTITLSANCDNTGGEGEVTTTIQLPGTWDLEQQGTNNTNTYSATTTNPNDLLLFLPAIRNASATLTFSPAMVSLSSSTATNTSYNLAVGAAPQQGQVYSTSVSYGCGSDANCGYVAVLNPDTQPTYPQQPRLPAPPDLGAPVTTLTLASAAATVFNAAQAHAWDQTLTQNETTTFVGGADGQNYEFTFCADSGGPYTIAKPTNVNVTNWPGASGSTLLVPISSCLSYSATYDGATATLIFTQPTTTYVPTVTPTPSTTTATGSSSGGSSIATSTTLSVTSGSNYIVGWTAWFTTSATVTAITDSAGNTCKILNQNFQTAAGGATFACPVTATSATDTVTATFSTSVQYPFIISIYAPNTSGVISGNNTYFSSSGTSPFTPMSFTAPIGSFLLGFIYHGGGGTITANSPWTLFGGLSNASYDIATSTATYSPSWTTSIDGNGIASAIVLIPGGPGIVTGSVTALAANSCGDTVTATAPGATTSMGVTVTPQTALGAGLIIDSGTTRVSAANTLTIGYCNVTAGSLTPAASNLNVRIQP